MHAKKGQRLVLLARKNKTSYTLMMYVTAAEFSRKSKIGCGLKLQALCTHHGPYYYRKS